MEHYGIIKRDQGNSLRNNWNSHEELLSFKKKKVKYKIVCIYTTMCPTKEREGYLYTHIYLLLHA